jgi:hypothetical protein
VTFSVIVAGSLGLAAGLVLGARRARRRPLRPLSIPLRHELPAMLLEAAHGDDEAGDAWLRATTYYWLLDHGYPEAVALEALEVLEFPELEVRIAKGSAAGSAATPAAGG